MKTINPRQARACAAAVATLLVAAACGDGETANPPATSAAVPNTAPSTILPPPTTQPPETQATTTVPSPTSTPSTAPATTAPLSEEEAAKQAVIDAAENAWYLFNEAKLDPTNDAKVAAALAVYAGNARIRVEQILRSYRESNQRSVTSDIAPANAEIDVPSVQVDLTSGTASIELCDLNSNVKVERSDDGHSDRVIDDGISAYRTRDSFQLVDGQWLVTDAQDLHRYEGELVCNDVG